MIFGLDMLMSPAIVPHASFWPPDADLECPHAVHVYGTFHKIKLQAQAEIFKVVNYI